MRAGRVIIRCADEVVDGACQLGGFAGEEGDGAGGLALRGRREGADGRGNELAELLDAGANAPTLIAARRADCAHEDAEIVHRGDDDGVDRDVPLDRAIAERAREALQRARDLGDPHLPRHRRAAAQVARVSAERARIGPLVAGRREERVEAIDVIGRFQDKKVQQPIWRRHFRSAHVRTGKVGLSSGLVNAPHAGLRPLPRASRRSTAPVRRKLRGLRSNVRC